MNSFKVMSALMVFLRTRRRGAPFNPGAMYAAALASLSMLPTPTPAAPFKADRALFFQKCAVLPNYEMNKEGTAAVRSGKTQIDESTQGAVNQLFDAWEKFGDEEKNRLAFVLATARRESMSTFLPIREAPSCGTNEICRERAIGDMLEKRATKHGVQPRANYALPNKDGRRFYGRGFLQLTFEDNYRRTGKILGIDLVKDPDKALDPQVAGEVLVRAILDGWYGSKKPLSSYINSKETDWINARNNVNPGSPNKPITAAYAMDLAKCLAPAS